MGEISVTEWQALSPLLDELLEAHGETRAQRLAEIRSGDAALAVRLETLLDQRTAVERDAFLEDDAFAVAQEPSLAGQTVGAYTLREQTGHGGMGSVWRAERSDGRYQATVAVKFLNLALLGRGGVERFAREGNMLARLSHPNIARLLDAGVTAGNQPYLVLEYIDGVPIDAWCDQHALSVEARLRLFLDVLAAVAHAHSNLILHRDLKPSNILITQQGQVKLLDFGIGKLIADQSTAASPTELTQLAGRAFTPDFAAPEQIAQGDVTTATDVYALGVLLYLLLAGRHPTNRPTYTQVDRLRAVVEAEPLRPSDAVARTRGTDLETVVTARVATPRKLARLLRGDLDNIVAKALKKAQGERYRTASELADDVRRHLHAEPITARPDSLVYRLGKFVRRYRFAVAAASFTFVALLAGVVGTTWQTIEARRERDEALFQAERALAKGNLVNLMLGAIGDANRPLTQQELLARSAALVEKQFSSDPRIAVDLLLPIAGHFISQGDTESELAILERAAAIVEPTKDQRLIALVACNTVDTEVRKGRVDRARVLHDKGMRALALLGKPDVGIAIACMRGEIEMALLQGDLDRALGRTKEAVALAEQHGRTKGSMYPMLLSYLAGLHRQKGDLQASFDSLKREQRRYEARGETDIVDYQSARNAEAALLMTWGEYRGAQEIIETLMLRWSNDSGATAPPWLARNRGYMKLRLGDASAAEQLLRSAVQRFRSHNNASKAVPAELLFAQALVTTHRFDEASALIATLEKDWPPVAGRYFLLTPATVHAQLLLAQGLISEAERVIEGELERIDHTSPQDSISLSAALRAAVQTQTSLGKFERAAAYARQAATVSERIARNPETSADVGEALLLLSQAQQALGDKSEAVATARRALVSLSNGFGDDHPLTREARALADS